MIDDTVIEKPFSKTNECVYWQYSSKNADFITGISLTVLLWSDGKSITRQQIVKEYRDRWKIEVFFRNLKQLCH